MQKKQIDIVAAVISNRDRNVLLVRKQGTKVFMQPGGKREQGEDSLQTLARELSEEIGVQIVQSTAAYLGDFKSVAVNEVDKTVCAEVFVVEIKGVPSPRAEIEEIAWVSPQAPFPVHVAPLSSEKILPAYCQAHCTSYRRS